jgi:NAD(P)-dependent dehydrogenase (short-subunit alcohol dehydrogenase family)
MATSRRLQGSRVLITGASSGVGLAAARLFAREGADVALLARGRKGLEAAARMARAEGAQAHVVVVDLGDRDATERAVADAVRRLGGLDVFVSNAAALAFGHFAEVPADDFDRTVAITFTGAVNAIRAALPHLRGSRGTVVATTSLNSRVPLPTFSSYSAAKHALRGFLNTLRVEEKEQRSGVRVAMVHPGPIDTPVFERATSATGYRPQQPPDAYRAEVVAQALVETALRPRAEVYVGGETRAVDVLFGLARPLAEGILLGVDRWYRTGSEPAARAGALWRPMDGVSESGGMPGRDSLLAWTRAGRRLFPRPAAPIELMSNLAGTAARGTRLLPRLLGGPVPEVRRGEGHGPARLDPEPAQHPDAAAAAAMA